MQRLLAVLFCALFAISAQAATALQRIQQLIAQQQYSAAAKQGETLLQDQPDETRVRFLTAYAYQMSKRPVKAKALYQSLIKDNPALPEPRNNLAMIYLDEGDYDRASQLLVDAINTHPTYATAYRNLNDIYTGIASEAYRHAVSESSEPSQYTHKIELTAIAKLEIAEPEPAAEGGEREPAKINFVNQETLLLEKVKAWAQAWSAKNVAAYAGFYAPRFRADFASHEEWLAYRRQRIERPGRIQVEVRDIQIKWRSENRAIIDFKQAFDSARYSDRVVKRLSFSRFDEQWKITQERVLSVL